MKRQAIIVSAGEPAPFQRGAVSLVKPVGEMKLNRAANRHKTVGWTEESSVHLKEVGMRKVVLSKDNWR